MSIVGEDQVGSGEILKIAKDSEGYYWSISRTQQMGIEQWRTSLWSQRDQTYFTNASGLPDNLTTIEIDQVDVVWIGSVNGLIRYQNGLFEQVSESRVLELAVDTNNVLWVAQPNGLFHFDGTELVEELNESGEPLCQTASTVAVSPLGVLWVSCYNQIYRLTSNRWELYAQFGVTSLDFFSNGELWAGTGVGLYDDGGMYVPNKSVGGGYAFTLPDRENQAWIALPEGLVAVEGAERGTGGEQVGGPYWPRPCLSTLRGCPNLEFVPISGGMYEMGDDDYQQEAPRHTVSIQDFEMMRSEITTEHFRVCDSHLCEEILRINNRHNSFDAETYPLYLNWYEIMSYAYWVGARLPSEAEWEYAARSEGQDVIFPWGNEPRTCERAHHPMFCGGATTPVCSHPAGHTDQGLCDMIGHRREWTLDQYHENYEGAPSNGQGWCTGRCPENSGDPLYWSHFNSFRLVRNAARTHQFEGDDEHARFRAENNHGLGGRLVKKASYRFATTP